MAGGGGALRSTLPIPRPASHHHESKLTPLSAASFPPSTLSYLTSLGRSRSTRAADDPSAVENGLVLPPPEYGPSPPKYEEAGLGTPLPQAGTGIEERRLPGANQAESSSATSVALPPAAAEEIEMRRMSVEREEGMSGGEDRLVDRQGVFDAGTG